MQHKKKARLLNELRVYSRNLLKIRTVSFCREAQDFREMMRSKLLEKERDLRVCLVEIMEAAELCLKKADLKKDTTLCEYFRAVRADIAFILTAIETLPGNNAGQRVSG
ncbi:MAG: hypothetical protein QHG99_01350 [Methanomicrobiales archaeon]|jgi:hypothetical protein|nr:hypothetical protein [Methanomicrobiales archaeon]